MIRIDSISKSFHQKSVINDLSLEIPSGKITALVGKNGAGKSTLIRLITGLLKPDSGTIVNVDNLRIASLLGSDIRLYNNLTAKEIIFLFGRLKGLSKGAIERRIDELNESLDFRACLNQTAKTFSKGMAQKIAFVSTVIDDPDYLLLDEPSTGLDLLASHDVVSFLKYLSYSKKTILLATHNIFEISDLSDHIAVLANGRITSFVDTKAFFCQWKNNQKTEALVKMIDGE